MLLLLDSHGLVWLEVLGKTVIPQLKLNICGILYRT